MKKLLLLAVIVSVYNCFAQDRVGNIGKVAGNWYLSSINNLDKSSGEKLNPETSLFRDMINGQIPVILKESGEFLFFKDKKQEKWKCRFADNSTIHLIEFEERDAKGEVTSAYIDYKIEVLDGRLKLYREDPSVKEEYIFSPVKK